MSQKIKLVAFLLAVCMMVGVLAACSTAPATPSAAPTEPNAPTESPAPAEPEADEPFTITIAQSSDPQSLDPHKVGGDIGANVFRNICENLFFYDENWAVIPVLAESYEQVSDTEWTVKLKEGITFSNGEAFNAEAAIWNFKRAASEEFPRQNYMFKKYVSEYEAVDELTVKFILSKPDIFFIEHLAEVPMLAPAYSEQIGEEAIGGDPIGTGPYVFVSWEADKEIVLEKNPAYWGEEPEIDRIVVRTIPEAATRVAEMINGTVDIIMNVQYESTEMLQNADNISIVPKKMNRIEYIAYNTYDWAGCPALQNKLVRQALNYAVDVQAIIDNIMGGFGERASTLWRSDYDGYDETLANAFTYDPEKAKALLAEAGYPDGFDLVLMTDVDNHAKAQEVTEAVGAYLTAIGINVEVQVLDDTTAYAIIVNGQEAKQCPPMFDWNWGGKPNQYESTLTGVLHSTGMSSYNVVEGYDAIIDSLLVETTKEGRAPYIQQIQQLMVDDPACLYLFRLYDIYAVNNRIDWNPLDHYCMLVSEMSIAK
jgi:peptide/nickel transport system substrate-binding protein